MTLHTDDNRIDYAPSGSSSYAYNFRVDHEDDMFIFLDGVEVTSGWSITGLGEDIGGTVDFDTPPVGTLLVLFRNVPLTQETDYEPYDPFPAATHEQALDKLTMICQQLQSILQEGHPGGGGAGFVQITGDTMSGNLEILRESPALKLHKTSAGGEARLEFLDDENDLRGYVGYSDSYGLGIQYNDDQGVGLSWLLMEEGGRIEMSPNTPILDTHVANKAYVDFMSGGGGGGFVAKSGDTMTGPLVISMDNPRLKMEGLNDTEPRVELFDEFGVLRGYMGFSDAYGLGIQYNDVAGDSHSWLLMEENGQVEISANVPTKDTHIANKKYVDDVAGAPGGGFVQVAGDTMTGNLTIRKSAPALVLTEDVAEGECRVEMYDQLDTLRGYVGFDQLYGFGLKYFSDAGAELSWLLLEENGQVEMSANVPTKDTHIANKAYVDDNSGGYLAIREYSFSQTTNITSFSYQSITGASVTVPAGWTSGEIKIDATINCFLDNMNADPALMSLDFQILAGATPVVERRSACGIQAAVDGVDTNLYLDVLVPLIAVFSASAGDIITIRAKKNADMVGGQGVINANTVISSIIISPVNLSG